MIPKDPAYEARVRESFSRQSHMATLGAEIVFIAPGEVHLAFPFAAQFCQQNGFMHAGAIASVADSANGYAAYTLAPPETDVRARRLIESIPGWRARGYPVDHDPAGRQRAAVETAPARVTRNRGGRPS